MGGKLEQWKASCLSVEISPLKRAVSFYFLSVFVLITAITYFWCSTIISGKVKIDPFVLAALALIQFSVQFILLHHQYKSLLVPAYVRTATELFVLASSVILLFFVLSSSYS